MPLLQAEPATLPYRSYNQALQAQFGCKVYKVSVDGGFTCPNRDGSKGIGGCTFCDETGSSSRTNPRKTPITQQMLSNIEHRQRRFGAQKFIAYFQSYTNTYSNVARLQRLYDEALAAHPDVVGLAVSTRPDCVDPAKLDLLASYHAKTQHVSVEYGLQTIHNASLERVNRCETVEDFEQAFLWTKERNLDHCIHVILGMPGETHADMMATADQLAAWGVAAVKIHMLVAMENTPIAEQYRRGEWHSMSLAEYVTTCADFLERLHPECIIHRIAGNGHFKHVVAPSWMASQRNDVIQAIVAELHKRGTRQGSKCRYLTP
jgi:radical SAM protein (TIGR01212 family)